MKNELPDFKRGILDFNIIFPSGNAELNFFIKPLRNFYTPS